MWLCQADTRQCWRLAKSTAGFSSPAWSPDGQQIAYARLSTDSAEKNRLEIMAQRGFKEPRVLVAGGLSAKAEQTSKLENQARRLGLSTVSMAPAWSPRGKFMSVPWLDPPGIAIIRMSDAAVLATYPDAICPSWSPDENYVSLVLPGDAEGFHVTAPNFGPAQPAVATKHAVQPAIWEPTGQAFHVIGWRAQPASGALPPYSAELVRYDLKTQKTEVIRPVLARRPPAGEDPASLYFARAPGNSTIFAIAPGGSEMTDALELALDRQTPARRYTLLDTDLQTGAPSFGTDKQTLAVRFGPPQSLGVPALFDLRTAELRAIIPDNATQILAVQTIMERILHVFETSTPADAKNPTVRWVRFPTPAALSRFALQDARPADRIERLGRFGLGLFESTPEGTPDANERRTLVEAKLFLSYIVGDFASALRNTEALEPLLVASHDRQALSVVRAQCYMGQHKWSAARELLTLLSQKAGKESDKELAKEASKASPTVENDRTIFLATVKAMLEEIAESDK